MELVNYQKEAARYAFYPAELGVFYTTLAMCGECGEFANKIKKVVRDQNGNMADCQRKDLAMELGDILWYVANTATELGYSLNDIADNNLTKLRLRKQKGTLSGSGDDR